ncbi:MAG: cytochrome c oxidase assembly protein [Ilumatobacter sp.]|nr:cytochrome c oxidase assembly protein [Ilumatobacter sp.]
MTIGPAHSGAPPLPHDLLTAWNIDPLLIGGLLVVAIAHRRGARPEAEGRARTTSFWVGWAGVVVALVSPLDAASEVLLSVHMVQHVLLVAVAAPLLAFSTPGAALLRGSPRFVRRAFATGRASLGLTPTTLGRLRSPAARWLAFVALFWLWHSSVLYGAAVESRWIHALEHVSFLGSAWLLWTAIVGPRRARVDRGSAVLAVFLLSLQSVLLSTLMTFARTPWYEPYADGASGWSIDPLADQQLAGVIMWVPSGAILTALGLWLFVAWLREIDAHDHDGLGSPTSRAGTSTP